MSNVSNVSNLSNLSNLSHGERRSMIEKVLPLPPKYKNPDTVVSASFFPADEASIKSTRRKNTGPREGFISNTSYNVLAVKKGLVRRRHHRGRSIASSSRPLLCWPCVLPFACLLLACVIADILDPALLRPGRLDRKIEIPLPNETSRLDIMKIHSAPITKRGEIDFESVVKVRAAKAGRQAGATMKIEAFMS